MAYGNVATITFTPAAAGVVQVIAVYDAYGTSGGDFGGSYDAHIFCAISGSGQINGSSQGMTTTRTTYTASHTFNVSAGVATTVGLWGECVGATAVEFDNITLSAFVAKR
jgi:hypothetical protein